MAAAEFSKGIIQPTLIDQLRSILDQYPDDNQILKELIQNAEDAGASRVTFLYDRTQYACDRLHNSALSTYQGPALYAYNDARFSKDDWESVRMIHKSLKRDDPMKVGRFGLGFKSVFHITDLPGVLSGDQVGFLDPHEEFFETVTERGGRKKTSSFAWNLTDSSLRDIPDQMAPFKQSLFGSESDYARDFPGTLFRFPLRQRNHNSDISSTEYNDAKIRQLFDMFRYEAHAFLLFLNSLEQIDIYEKDGPMQEPRLLLSVKVSDAVRGEVRSQRAGFKCGISALSPSHPWLPQPVVARYRLETEVQVPGQSAQVRAWLVTQYFDGGGDTSLKNILLNNSAKMLPWVGVALPLDRDCQAGQGDGREGQGEPGGQVFCFLPLPAEQRSATGFHFHVHGYFAVNQNRRHLKWPSADYTQAKHKDHEREWNSKMAGELVPRALRELVLHAVSRGEEPADVYRLFPNPQTAQEHWSDVVPTFYRLMQGERVYHSAESGGRWVTAGEACRIQQGDAHTHILTRILLGSSLTSNLVCPPQYIVDAMPATGRPKMVEPVMVKDVVAAMDTGRLSESERTQLLQYFTHHSVFSLLNHLKLCQPESGVLQTFATQCYHVASDARRLLPGLRHLFHAPTSGQLDSTLSTIARSGRTGLREKGANDVPELLRDMFPQTAQPVALNNPLYGAGSLFKVDKAWLDAVWDHIQRHSYNIPVTRYEGLPLLLSNSKLYSLTKSQPYIKNGSHGNVSGILQKLGFIVVEQVHSQAQQYVQSFDPEGVLKGMATLPDYVKKVRQLQENDKRELRGFLANISYTNHTGVLTNLPIFETFLTLHESHSATNKWLSGGYMVEGYSERPCVQLPQGARVLDLHSDSVRRLAQTTGVTVITDMQLFTSHILPQFQQYSNEQKITITTHILTNLEKYRGLENRIKEIECIPTTSGDFKRPCDVYDPNDQKIKTLFGDFDLLPFPRHPFTDGLSVVKLRGLGMCSIDDIKAEHLLKLAQHVDKCVLRMAGRKDNINKVKKQGKALTEFLNDHHHFLKSQVIKDRRMTHLKDAVSDLRFIPFKKERPYTYENHIPWFHNDLCLTKPSDVSTHYYLVGSQMPTPEGSCNQLSQAFSWDARPPSEAVLCQLQTVIDNHSNGHSMSTCVTNIYNYLQSEIPKNQFSIEQRLAELGEWIWSGSGFVSPSQVVFTSDLGIAAVPHIHVCQPALRQYRQLFEATGVNEHADWPDVLERIKDYHGDNHLSHEDFKRDKAIVMAILSKVIERGELTDDLLIPVNTSDSTLNLKPRSQCTFCDATWMQRGHAEEDIDDLGEDIYIIHPDISQKVAESLGVPSFMSRYLDAEELDMGYGQSEPLTRRIHNILEDYKDGSAVLKELLQNADDAGATEVAFIYDRRNMASSSETLLDRNMKSLQGPAIWAYNNAVFSDEDFANIVKLSGATKKDQPTKIGRFGLGFNAVYHLSDVPSFVSRENIVFFDPHTTYLGHSIRNPSKPGIKLSMEKHASRITRFSDQFKPYHGLFGLDMATDFDGTLFRLPLRTKDQASKSEISSKVYDDSEVKSLFELLFNGSESLLLFTQCVQKVRVYTIDENESISPSMMQSFVIEKSIENVIRPMFTDSQDVEEEYKILYLSNKAKAYYDGNHSNCFITKVTVSGSVPGRHMPADSKTCHWVVCGAIGSKAAKSLADDHSDLLPVGGVAGRLEVDSDINKYRLDMLKQNESQIFCFLPLPIRHELPVHVNGYFAVTSSRNHLHDDEETEKSDVRARWNRALMEDAVCAAYLEMFCCMLQTDEFDQEHLLKNIFDFFPGNMGERVKGRSNPAYCLMKAFLEEVFLSGDREMLPSGNVWVNGKTFRALDRNAKQSELCDQMTQVCHIVFNNNEDEHFVDMPFAVYNDLESCEIVDLISDHFITVKDFYSDVFLPNVHLLPIDVTEDLILYALTNFEHKFDSLLKEHACIPVYVGTGQQQFKRPDVLVNPSSSLAGLFDRDEGYFPLRLLETKSSVEREKWKNGLQRLGMRENNLENDEVLERARSVKDMTDSEQALKRSECLLVLLERMQKENLMEIGLMLKGIKFIKKQAKPKHWILTWKGEQWDDFLALSEIYDEDFQFMGCVCPLPVFGQYASRRNLKQVKDVLDIHVRLDETHGVDFMQKCSSYLENQSESKDEISSSNDRRLFNKLINSCYDWCNGCADKLDFTNIRDEPFIFISQGTGELVKPSQCVESMKQDCKPFLYKVPYEIRYGYPKLITALAIRKKCEPTDYVTLLQKYKSDNDIVPMRDRDAILKVIKALAECLLQLEKSCDLKEKIAELEPIYVVNDEWKFCVSSELNFNTTDWLQTKERSKLCIMKLSPEEAKLLGVKTTREAIIDNFTLGVSFGQREELTNRIRRLLEGYPCDKEVLKELLQNADDAGASEIHFILDEREYGCEKIFGESWRHLQGPALLVYNDKPFTERDIKGIQRLGEGSKADDAITTGKYGVGFNCVYHLTDTPTFLSRGEEIGERLCAFDPQCQYVPASDKQDPGRMFKVDDNFRADFPDVFECYDIPEINRSDSTIFRLPLRSEEVSKESKFGKSPVTLTTVRNLFERFQEEMPVILLFLRNVRKITISERTVNGTLKTVSCTESSLSAEDAAKKNVYNQAVKDAARVIKDEASSLADVGATEVAYKMEITSNDISQTFLICQRIGFSDSDNISQGIIEEYEQKKASLLPQGGVAYNIFSKKRGKKKVKEKHANQTYPRTATEDWRPKSKPLLFCFLPLPRDSNVPMHINGHFILNGETRSDIYESNKFESFESRWNKLLFNTVIANAYIGALKELKIEIPSAEVPYGSIQKPFDLFASAFPHNPIKELRPVIQSLQKSVYRKIVKEKHELVPIIRRQEMMQTSQGFPKQEVLQLIWRSCESRVYFDNLKTQLPAPPEPYGRYSTQPRPPPPPAPGAILQNALLNMRFPFTALPTRNISRFNEALKADHPPKQPSVSGTPVPKQRDLFDFIEPEDVVSFLHDYRQSSNGHFHVPCAVGETPFVSPQAVKIAFRYVEKCNGFEGLPLLLTRDGILREFQSNDAYVLATSFSSLIPNCPEKFLHDIYGVYSEWKCRELHKQLSPFVKYMTIEEFADIIGEHLCEGTYNDREKVDAATHAIPDAWLGRFYQFVYKQVFEHENADGSGRLCFSPQKLAPLHSWCLVPIVHQGHKYLIRLKDTCEVFNTFYPQLLVLDVLPLPRIHITLEQSSTEGISEVLTRLAANTGDPYNLLKAVHKVLCNQNNMQQFLNNRQANEFWLYFQDHIGNLQGHPDAGQMLRNLPLHMSISGAYIPLMSKKVIIVPSSACFSELERVVPLSHAFLLKIKGLKELYKFIECSQPSFEEFYCKFVLSRTDQLSSQALYLHMGTTRQYIEKTYELKEDNNLVNVLKGVSFIPKEDGFRHRACDFYNPDVSLFEIMHSGDEFPVTPYDTETWRPFLKRIGLISKVTDAMCVKYAKEIASGKRSHTLSQDLVEFILHEKDNSIATLRQLSSIRFIEKGIVPEDLCEISLAMDGGLISYDMSTYSEYTRVCWTVVPILPDWAVPGHRLGDNRSFISKPTNEQMMQHLQNLVTSCRETLGKKSSSDVMMMQDIFVECLEHLNKNGLFQHTIEGLKQVYCVISSHGYFFKPNQIVRKIDSTWMGIQPGVLEIPPRFVRVADVLKILGMTETITLAQTAEVLKSEFLTSSGDLSGPNQIVRGFFAAKLFFKLALKSKETDVTELYFPTQDKRIVPSHQLILVDKLDYLKRSVHLEQPYLISLHTLDQGTPAIPIDSQMDVIEKIPVELRPKLLSQIVEERLDDSCVNDLQTSPDLDLQNKLSSPVLHQCILRMIKHDEKSFLSTEENDSLMDTIEEALSRIQIVGITEVRTYLWKNNQRIEESRRRRAFYFSKNGSLQASNVVLYLAPDIEMHSSHLSVRLSKVILQLSSLFKNRECLKEYLPILMRENVGRMENVLDDFEIRAYGGLLSFRETPEVGKFVPQTYIGMLEQTFARLGEGEYVAFEVDDPLLEDVEDDTEQPDATYIYVKILNVIIPECDQDPADVLPVYYKYKVDNGSGLPEVIDGVYLYRFREKRVYTEPDNMNLEHSVELHNNQETQDQPGSPQLDKSLDEINDYITQCLLAAEVVGERERRAIWKRLRFEFHPDRNPERIQIATQAFQFLQNQIERLERGEDISRTHSTEQRSSGRSRSHSSYDWFSRNSSNFSSRARHHEDQRETFTDYSFSSYSNHRSGGGSYRSYGGSSGGSYSGRSHHQEEHRANPQPSLARRWLKQAAYDLQAVPRDMASHDQQLAACESQFLFGARQEVPYEWACSKAFQAAKKATRAAQYAVDAAHTEPQWSTLNACGCDDAWTQLKQVVGREDDMQYPSRSTYHGVPRDHYTAAMATKARDLATQVFNACRDYVHRQN